jgi:protein-disulfide isomerase/uncharacterized membrane protein
MTEGRRLERLRWCVLVLGLAGFIVSFESLRQHILHVHGFAVGGSFCDISDYVNCNAVNASEWSTFFGVPIASYGIFFYLALFGLTLVSGQGKAVSGRTMASLALLGGVISVLLSLLLFSLSLFVIRALCILCIALYCINGLLLSSAWLLAFKNAFAEGLLEGLKAIMSIVGSALGSEDRHVTKGARLTIASIVLLAACSWAVGPLMLKLFATKSAAGVGGSQDSLLSWRNAPVVSIPVDSGGGMLGDYAKGEPGAPIQIVEFADFECPGCRQTYVGLNQVLKKYAGRYQLIFRNYPLDHRCNPGITKEFHQHACAAALFSRCVGEQGKFWEGLDWLFSLPELEGFDFSGDIKELLVTKGAQSLELDPEALAECMNSDRQIKKIQEDILVADSLGLESTPAFWINGKRFPRATVEGLEMAFASIVGAK